LARTTLPYPIPHPTQTHNLTLTLTNPQPHGTLQLTYTNHQTNGNHSLPASIFIPASRSFFATLQRNIFSFLSHNIPLDPLISQFGAKYEQAKFLFTQSSATPTLLPPMEKILAGTYVWDNAQDWLENGGKRTNLAHASSGQQEALPMLLVLFVWSQLRPTEPHTFFIEEPEAHLFPLSQKLIVELLASISQQQHHFVLTTHSPYILVAFNNLIMAGNVLAENPAISRAAVEEIIGGSFVLNYEDVAAYTIEDGVAVSIKDPDTRLIGASMIDEVSDIFDGIFGTLLEQEKWRLGYAA
jgi:hypothetical protein